MLHAQWRVSTAQHIVGALKIFVGCMNGALSLSACGPISRCSASTGGEGMCSTWNVRHIPKTKIFSVFCDNTGIPGSPGRLASVTPPVPEMHSAVFPHLCGLESPGLPSPLRGKSVPSPGNVSLVLSLSPGRCSSHPHFKDEDIEAKVS